jgi:hypothetical protein
MGTAGVFCPLSVLKIKIKIKIMGHDLPQSRRPNSNRFPLSFKKEIGSEFTSAAKAGCFLLNRRPKGAFDGPDLLSRSGQALLHPAC